MIIYKATNLVNGKVYVGKTSGSLERRIKRHLLCVRMGSENLFHRAIRKYGAENFLWEIIDAGLFIQLESYWIKKLNSKAPKGYNLTDGGEGRIGSKPSNKTKKTMSKMAKIRWLNPEYRYKMRKALIRCGRNSDPLLTIKKASELTGLSAYELHGLERLGILQMEKINSRVFRIYESNLHELPYRINRANHLNLRRSA